LTELVIREVNVITRLNIKLLWHYFIPIATHMHDPIENKIYGPL